MNVKQDRRLHFKNLIMNELETVKVTLIVEANKQLSLGNLSRVIRFIYTFGRVYDEPPTSPTGPLRLKMLRCLLTGS